MRSISTVFAVAVLSTGTLCACEAKSQPTPEGSDSIFVERESTGESHDVIVESPELVDSREAFRSRWPWRMELTDDEWPEVTTARALFSPPEGFERIDLESDGFADFLRYLPVRLDRNRVYSYAGQLLSAPSAAVAMLPVGDENLQQCADALLRLRAEYLWRAGRADEVAFHFTSGDESRWRAWQKGERFEVQGANVERTRGSARPDTHAEFVDYLFYLFRFAGTKSMKRDAERVPPDAPIEVGDFFLDPGAPGHAVIVVDIAEHPDGRRVALLGQSYMPAQEFHVIRGPARDALGGVWFELPEAEHTLDTPSWPAFGRDQVWRF